ncbi:hypothetical protein N7492_004537 [Penicillium capsulatum]|uniref:Uncharacterized protein n=1 Tax=Penicillium capsulatum TaxID=69766 RepID=A0A9W9I7T7_9EURO|nr:hypothetical protein N7492_004537 [Penicillium capsulatum]
MDLDDSASEDGDDDSDNGNSNAEGEDGNGEDLSVDDNVNGISSRMSTSADHWLSRGKADDSGQNTLPRIPSFQPYRDKDWAECKNFIAALETHFAQHQSYHTETRKVQLGSRLLGPEVKENWDTYVFDLRKGTTWDSYRVFIAQQLCRRTGEPKARSFFFGGRQLSTQTVSDFALWLKI